MFHRPSGNGLETKRSSTDQITRPCTDEKRRPLQMTISEDNVFFVYNCNAIAYIHVNKKPHKKSDLLGCPFKVSDAVAG